VENRYVVRGVNPATGSVVQSVVRAESTFEAQRQAEAAGLEHVIVIGASEPRVPAAAAGASLM
jgi:hypothetical protein